MVPGAMGDLPIVTSIGMFNAQSVEFSVEPAGEETVTCRKMHGDFGLVVHGGTRAEWQ